MEKRLRGRTIAAMTMGMALAALGPVEPAFAEGVQLKFGTTAPPGSHIARFFDKWVADLNAVNPAAVTMKTYHNTLGNTQTMFDSVKNAVADLGWFNPGYYPGVFKRIHLTDVPGTVASAEYGSVALWRLFEKGKFEDEFAMVRPIGFHAYPPSYIHTSFPLKKLDDLKGQKLGVTARGTGEALSLMGAVPISVGLYSFYQSTQKHLIEGFAGSWTTFLPFKLYEVANHHIEFNLGGSAALVAFNIKVYDGLSADAKKVVTRQAGLGFSRALGKFWDGVERQSKKDALGRAGHAMVEIPKADYDRMRKAIEPASADWFKNTPNGKQLHDAFKAEYEAARAMTN